jgi:hypothetical protein
MNFLNPTNHFEPTKNNLVYPINILPLKMLMQHIIRWSILQIQKHKCFNHFNITVFV